METYPVPPRVHPAGSGQRLSLFLSSNGMNAKAFEMMFHLDPPTHRPSPSQSQKNSSTILKDMLIDINTITILITALQLFPVATLVQTYIIPAMVIMAT